MNTVKSSKQKQKRGKYSQKYYEEIFSQLCWPSKEREKKKRNRHFAGLLRADNSH